MLRTVTISNPPFFALWLHTKRRNLLHLFPCLGAFDFPRQGPHSIPLSYRAIDFQKPSEYSVDLASQENLNVSRLGEVGWTHLRLAWKVITQGWRCGIITDFYICICVIYKVVQNNFLSLKIRTFGHILRRFLLCQKFVRSFVFKL